MSKKIATEELSNVSGGLRYQGSSSLKCPLCHKDIDFDSDKIRTETRGCTTYKYYTCPLCHKEFEYIEEE